MLEVTEQGRVAALAQQARARGESVPSGGPFIPAPGDFSGDACPGVPPEPGARHHIGQQAPTGPRPGVSIPINYSGAPPGSSLSAHPSTVVVEQIDHASASAGGFLAQLGPRRPAGLPGQPSERTAPNSAPGGAA